MTQEEFDYLRDMLKSRSGLVLGDEKRYLLESRLMPVSRELGLDSLSGLVGMLKAANDDDLRTKVTQAMTINESFFFRDKTPFDNFKNIMMPAMLESKRAASRTLRIWCAAASTGQEPYSLAILIKEMGAKFASWNIEIIGTDLSEEVLEKAKAGLYSQFEVQRGLPVQLMVKYFQQTGSMWQIDSSIRSMVTYKHFNLLDDYTSLGTFDIIFCRNVLIYFDPPTKSDMLGRMAKRMRADGYLVLGAAETVIGISDDFKPVADVRGLYSMQEGVSALGGIKPAVASATPVAAPSPSLIKTALAPAGTASAAPLKPATPSLTGSLGTPATAAPRTLSAAAPKPATPSLAGSLGIPETAAPRTLSAAAPKPATPSLTGSLGTPATAAPRTLSATPLTPAATPASVTPAVRATPAASTLTPSVSPATPAVPAKPAAPAASLATTSVAPLTPAATTLGVTPRTDTAKLA